MMKSITRSISRRLMLVVLSTTFLALLASGSAMLVYDVRAYRSAWIGDLMAQADILAEVSAPALAFDDPKAAQENLELLRTRPNILEAAIYGPNGRLFATYFVDRSGEVRFPPTPESRGYRIDGNRITVFHRIVKDREVVGTVYLRARYELRERLMNYLVILGSVMAGSLLFAVLMSTWIRAAFTKPILEITRVARNVMETRDFSLRAKKSTDDEIGLLADAFNDMLNEVERRAKALEESNRILEHEMTERRSAEQALRVADRRKDEFLATLAHELRNPLAPVLNGLELLRVTGDNPELSRRARDIMERQLKQMVRLVDDLLDVSRITTGKLAIRKEPVELQAVMRSAIEATGPFIEQCGHTLEVGMPPDPLYLDADPVRLAQVLSNLLNNAAKYTNEGGHIGFFAGMEQDQIVIRVRDNGIGISADMLPRIFDMFTQADASIERSHAGLGVGLTLSRRLVELHGGTVEAHSDGTGRGSTFTVRLQAALHDAEAQRNPELAAAAQEGSHFRILLADDNVDFATSLSTLLSAMGHSVKVTHDGAAAAETAAQFKPEFAFLDIGLPKLNGYELARRLRSHPSTSRTMLIAVTGWGQEKDRELAREAGFDHHLVKPVEFRQIKAVLDTKRPQQD
jgi:signal transduction histidine kinase/ActR/RegA family two-component response regulator